MSEHTRENSYEYSEGVGVDAEGKRGSDALLEVYNKGGFRLEGDVIEEFAQLLSQVDFDGVLIKGQPAPDYLRATFQLEEPDRVGAIVSDIMGLIGRYGTGKLPGGVKVFPLGIPWPERFVVDLVIAEHEHF